MKKVEFEERILNGVVLNDYRAEDGALMIYSIKEEEKDVFLKNNMVKEEVDDIYSIYNLENVDFVVVDLKSIENEKDIEWMVKIKFEIILFFDHKRKRYLPSQKYEFNCFATRESVETFKI